MTDKQYDLRVTDVALDLEPGTEKVPLAPLVYTLTASINDAALTKSVLAVLAMGKSKMPMEVDLEGARFVPGGAEITVNAGSGRFLRAKATAVVGITGRDEDTVSVEIREIKALGKLPIESIVSPILEKALDRATGFPGVVRDTTKSRGLLVTPNVLLKSQGIPLRFVEPGGWTVETASNSLVAKFAAK